MTDFSVGLVKNNGSYDLEVNIDRLPSFSYEGVAEIRLTVWADNKPRRIYYLGTTDNIEDLGDSDFPDVEKGRTKIVKGKMNVVKQDGSKEILGYTKEFPIQKFTFEDDDEGGEDETTVSLVKVDYDRAGELENLPFKMVITEDEQEYPLLLLHMDFIEVELKQKIAIGGGIAQTLIVTQAVREVLEFLIIDNPGNVNEPEMSEGWQQLWLLWAKKVSNRDFPEGADSAELHDWIEDVISVFSRKKSLIRKMKDDLRSL